MTKAEDRISNLPDPILHHILSFLKTKVVARTSILSKRWKYIWITIPKLGFHFQTKWDMFDDEDEFEWETNKFLNFVEGTLHRHSLSTNIEKFRLTSYENLEDSRLVSCISYMFAHNNVKELGLFLEQQDKPLCIPQSVFTCASMIRLELQAHHLTIPKCISFPRLKRLRLCHVVFNNDCWNEQLFSNSPVLEELHLEYCYFRMPDFCISIPTLRILEINSYHGIQNCALKIHAPRLSSIIYKGRVAREYVISGFVSLEEAVICFDVAEGGIFKRRNIQAFRQFLRALAHVKCLTVKDPPPQANNLFKNLPTYHNIKRFKITAATRSNVRVAVLIAMLKVTPNLESLVFGEKGKSFFTLEPFEDDMYTDNEIEENHDNVDEGNTADSDDQEDDGWALDMVATERLFLHLKSVRFKRIVWGPREMNCVKVILRNAKALQSFTVCHDFLLKSEQELLVQIESFPRASSSCTFKMVAGRYFWTSKISNKKAIDDASLEGH